VNWVDEAIKLGWKPPGAASDLDWKAKARSKGWIPPNQQILSSIGIECNPNDRGLRQTITIQTEEIDSIGPPLSQEPIVRNEDDADGSELELVRLLNPKRKKEKKPEPAIDRASSSSSFEFDHPRCVFETVTAPNRQTVLATVPCLTLFSKEPTVVDENGSSSSEDEPDLHAQIQELKNLTADHLASFQLSASEDGQSDDDDEPIPISRALPTRRKVTIEDSEEEDDDDSSQSDEDSELSSDPQAIIRRLTRGDPELMKYLELAGSR
jgi:hypothetical protein